MKHRGVLSRRFGAESCCRAWITKKEAADAFELAMQAAPDNRETYAQILSYLVVAQPDPELAESIVQRAQRQLTLDPEWKTYFSLWAKAVAGRAHAASPGEVDRLLNRLARSEAW